MVAPPHLAPYVAAAATAAAPPACASLRRLGLHPAPRQRRVQHHGLQRRQSEQLPHADELPQRRGECIHSSATHACIFIFSALPNEAAPRRLGIGSEASAGTGSAPCGADTELSKQGRWRRCSACSAPFLPKSYRRAPHRVVGAGLDSSASALGCRKPRRSRASMLTGACMCMLTCSRQLASI